MHGDSGIYGALVNMGAWFKCNIPMVEPHGNFGSIDNDGAASSRYCCTGDTKILTKEYGMKTYDELMKLVKPTDKEGYYEFENIIHVRGPYNEWVPTKVLIDSGVHDIYELTLANGYKLRGTPNHPVYVYTKRWIRLDKVEEGDLVVIDRHFYEDADGYEETEARGLRCAITPIESCVKLNEKERVYSLRIDTEDHAFMTNGILSHNTEARLTEYAEKVFLKDLSPDVVRYDWNYDDTLMEPQELPCVIPNVLINSTTGIAVGFACDFVSHNPREVIDLLLAYLENRDMNHIEAMKYLKGPDFPTGGTINGLASVQKAYACGDGYVTIRGKYHREEDKKGNEAVVIDEIPYGIYKTDLVKQIAQEIVSGRLEAKDVRDESDRNGIRIYIPLKKDEDYDRAVGVILANTRFEYNKKISMYGLNRNKVPKRYGLMELLKEFVAFREECIYKKLLAEKRKHEDRLHIIEGMFIVNKDLDKAISLIRGADGKEDSKKKLMKAFKLSEIQAEYICNLQLYRLSKTDMTKMREEDKNLKTRVRVIARITRSKSNSDIDAEMRNEWIELRDGLFKNCKRKTEIMAKAQKIDKEKTIKDENCTLVISKNGYIKRIAPLNENIQGRAGMGVTLGLSIDDEISQIINTTTVTDILALTTNGRAFILKPYTLEEVGRTSRGKLARNIFNLRETEKVILYYEIPKDSDSSKLKLMTATVKGIVKSTKLSEIDNLTASGKRLVGLKDLKDKVAAAAIVDKKDTVLLTSAQGNSIRFKTADISDTGVGAIGVIGMKLEKDDCVVSMVKVIPNDDIVFISETGYIKKVPENEFRTQNKGGYGVMTCPRDDGYGNIVAALSGGTGTVTIVTKSGKTLTCDLKTIRRVSRGSKGVIGIKLASGDAVCNIC